MFIPPINIGQFQPSPATIAEWVYQIWQFLQENPIATETEIREYIQSELTQSETLENAIDEYLTENPPPAPVQSVQGKTGAVQLAYNDIVTSSNAVPVYKAASTPSTSTLVGQYNLGYRLFVNTTTQEIYTISPAGALSLVGRGKFDGTAIDVNTAQGDTTIAEALNDLKPATDFITGSAAGSAGNYVSIVSYTAPADGIYQFNIVSRFNSSNTGGNREIGIRLNLNNSDYSPLFYMSIPDAWCRINGSDAIVLHSGDVVTVKGFCGVAVDNISVDLRVVRV